MRICERRESLYRWRFLGTDSVEEAKNGAASVGHPTGAVWEDWMGFLPGLRRSAWLLTATPSGVEASGKVVLPASGFQGQRAPGYSPWPHSGPRIVSLRRQRRNVGTRKHPSHRSLGRKSFAEVPVGAKSNAGSMRKQGC